MWRRFLTWRERLPFTDRLEQQQALLLEMMELSITAVAMLMLPLTLLSRRPLLAELAVVLLLLLTIAASLVAVALVRRGRLEASALMLSTTLVVLLSLMLYGNGLREGAVVLFAYSLPIAVAGMLAGRRGVIITCAIAGAGVAAAVLLARAGAPGAGFTARGGDNTVPSVVTFVVLAGLLGFFIESLRSRAAVQMEARRARERELEALGHTLEATVRERTAELEQALAALERRAAEAECLLEQNRRQYATIRALSVPVLPVDERTLVMPLIGELDGQRLDDLMSRALEAIERVAARRLLLDITGVPQVDSHIAQSLIRTLMAARLLGAEVVLVGVRPEVAHAIVGLGIDLGPIRAFADLQSALR
jgi:rsbT co-antagonist protein RsbR